MNRKVVQQAIFFSFIGFFLGLGVLQSQQNPAAGYFDNVFRNRKNVHQCTALFLHNLAMLRDSSDYNTRLLNRLHTDVLEIITTTEDKVWFTLKNNKMRADFMAHFWKQRDPTRPTLANERLFEHYKRLLYAREHYGNSSARTFDDRGRVYVRYGKPDENYIELPGEFTQVDFNRRTPVVGNDDLSFRKQFETWYYYKLKPKVVFDFVEEADGYHITYEIDQGLKTMDLPVWYDAVGKILERRKTISPALQAMAFSFNFGVAANEKGEAEMRSTLMDFGQKYKAEMEQRHKEIPPTESTFFEDLPFDMSLSYFENPDDRQTCIVSYGLRQKTVKIGESKASARIQFNTVLSDSFYNIFAEQNASAVIPKEIKDRKNCAAQIFNFRPGDFYVFAEVSNADNHQLGKQATFMKHIIRPVDSLGISSVVFAENIFTEPPNSQARSNLIVERNGIFIQPLPFLVLDKSKPPFVYFEIYGLDKNADGETNYQIEYIVKEGKDEGIGKVFKKLNPFGSGKTLIQIADPRTGTKTRDTAFVQLNLSRLGKGKYVVYVRVRDNVGQKMQMIAKSFTLR